MPTSREKLNEIAKGYHLSADVPDIFIENLCQIHTLKWVAKHTHPAGDLLELGYGDGLFTHELVQMGHTVTLLEGAQSLVAKVRSEYGDRLQIHHSLFEEFETEKTYDYVIATHVLEHVDNPVSVLSHMKSWLKPSGRLVVIVPNKESLHRQLAVLMNLQPQMDTLSDRDQVVGHQRVYSFETLAKDLDQAGFEVVERKGFFLKVLPNSMMLDFSEKLINALNEVADLVPDHLLANIGAVVKLKASQ